ncbi:hypothetical protein XELAEV_18042492mg [Xenopus laevis]|uniref:Uncharacterized protein n=1 Tax=Xenopus laevis TaxID=8355 RepID=A0A974C489_XENLA|nr:hypothetical protein XELAEV_18042492mg [Xenopus laevis]
MADCTQYKPCSDDFLYLSLYYMSTVACPWLLFFHSGFCLHQVCFYSSPCHRFFAQTVPLLPGPASSPSPSLAFCSCPSASPFSFQLAVNTTFPEGLPPPLRNPLKAYHM